MIDYRNMLTKTRAILLLGIFLAQNIPVGAFVGSTQELFILSEYGDNENIALTLDQEAHDLMKPIGLGAVSNLLLTALYQEVPVLVPAHLWNVILEHKNLFDDVTQAGDISYLYQKYGAHNRFRTKRDLKIFQEQCRLIKERYLAITESLADGASHDKIKQLLTENPIFDPAHAPTSIRRAPSRPWFELSLYLLSSYVPLDKYQIKEVAVDSQLPFYLFLPKSSLQHAHNTPHIPGLSSREIALGLKVDHFNDLTEPLRIRHLMPDVASRYQEALLKTLPLLFIDNKEIPENLRNRWAFYVMGHGTYSDEAYALLGPVRRKVKTLTKRVEQLKREKKQAAYEASKRSLRSCLKHEEELEKANRIVGLSLDQFRRFLLYLDESLNTGLVHYSSCSAGGMQFIKAFEHLDLSYTVLADTLVEAPAFNATPVLRLDCRSVKRASLDQLIDWEKRTLRLDTLYDFPLFFAKARIKKPSASLIHELLQSVNPAHRNHAPGAKRPFLASEVNNLSSIRLPRALSFDVIDGTDAFLRLESTSANKPITLEPEKEILLLSSHEIPALIVEHMAPFPLVVSYIPGKAAHVIAELQAPQHTLSEIIDCFFPCVGLGVSKLVIIKKLTCANDLKPSVKSDTFTDVILLMVCQRQLSLLMGCG